MKELDEVMKTLADGLRSLSVGIAAIAAKVDDLAKDRQRPAPRAEKKSAPVKKPAVKVRAKASAKKKSAPKPSAGSAAKATATASVLQVIGESAGGADMAVLRAKTGLADKQIANALYKLKKQKKVKSEKRGMYTVA